MGLGGQDPVGLFMAGCGLAWSCCHPNRARGTPAADDVFWLLNKEQEAQRHWVCLSLQALIPYKCPLGNGEAG